MEGTGDPDKQIDVPASADLPTGYAGKDLPTGHAGAESSFGQAGQFDHQSGKENAVDKVVPRKEILGWAMFDVANSSYVTVVNTAIFNAYFVGTVASKLDRGEATFLLTQIVATANLLIVLTAPIIGTVADFSARKKHMLFVTSFILVLCTFMLASVGPGDIAKAAIFLILANLMFGTGEDLIASFLPEIADQKNMGKVSAFGWTLGYFGGLTTMALCLAYIMWAEKHGQLAQQYVPVTMIIVGVVFLIGSTPTFLLLKERAKPNKLPQGKNYLQVGFERLAETLKRVTHYRDLFVFLFSLMSFTCGSTTVALMAAIFAEQVMGFKSSDTLGMLIVVNLAGAAGAFTLGALQNKLGSVRTVALALVVWIISVSMIYFASGKVIFWIAAILMGAAMGASQSAGRALVGQFSPPNRSAEFFGLWGLAVKLAAIIGPVVYGFVTQAQGDLRVGLLSTISFFVVGLAVLYFVDEERGKANAMK